MREWQDVVCARIDKSPRFVNSAMNLQAELAAQLAEESRLNVLIQENLAKVVVDDE